MSTTQLLPNVYQQFFGITGPQTGLALAGGLLYSYQAGTTTPQATYTDETGATPNSNPIVLNSVGAANIWLSSNSYKFQLQDSLGNVQWTVDNVKYINLDSISGPMLQSSIAGLALDQNGSGNLDVQVDNVTIEVNGSNDLAVKTGGISADTFVASSKLEVLFKNTRDLTDPGTIRMIPQYEWTSPTLLSFTGTLPAGAATVGKWSPNGEFLAVGGGSANYLDIYQLSSPGAPLNDPIFTKLADPDTLPTGGVDALSWSPSGDFLAVVYGVTPFITIYQRIGNAFVALPQPASIPTVVGGGSMGGLQVVFSPNSDFLALSYTIVGGSSAGSNLIMYERGWLGAAGTTSGTGTGSITIPVAGENPGSAPNYYIYNTGGSPQGNLSSINFPFTTADTGTYTPAGPIFTDITTASTLSGIGKWIAWSADSSLFAAMDASTQVIDVFQREDFVFTGITPPTLTSYVGYIESFSFSPDGNFLAVNLGQAPWILIFQITNGVFTQLTSPITLAESPGIPVWSANSEYLALSKTTTPYLLVYKVTNPTTSPVFTLQTAVATPPAGQPQIVDWSQTKQFLAVTGATTPYIQVYQTASSLTSDGFLWVRATPNV